MDAKIIIKARAVMIPRLCVLYTLAERGGEATLLDVRFCSVNAQGLNTTLRLLSELGLLERNGTRLRLTGEGWHVLKTLRDMLSGVVEGGEGA